MRNITYDCQRQKSLDSNTMRDRSSRASASYVIGFLSNEIAHDGHLQALCSSYVSRSYPRRRQKQRHTQRKVSTIIPSSSLILHGQHNRDYELKAGGILPYFCRFFEGVPNQTYGGDIPLAVPVSCHPRAIKTHMPKDGTTPELIQGHWSISSKRTAAAYHGFKARRSSL